MIGVGVDIWTPAVLRQAGLPWPMSLFADGAKGDAIIPARFASDMWVDSAGATPVAANADKVGRIVGPNGHLMVQTGGPSVKWTYGAGGGLHWIDADGVDDWIESAAAFDFGSSPSLTVFAALRQEASSLGALFETSAVPTGTTGTARLGVTNGDEGSGRVYVGLYGSNNSAAVYDNNAVMPASRIITAQFDIAGATIAEEQTLRVNGALAAPTVVTAGPAGTGNLSNQKIYVGRRGGTSGPLDGRLWGLIWTTKTLTAGEIEDTEGRLSDLSGITW